MSDPALSARRPLLDERRHRATLVTGDPLELRSGASVENELSAQLHRITTPGNIALAPCPRADEWPGAQRSPPTP
jgi:hypothetical protein